MESLWLLWLQTGYALKQGMRGCKQGTRLNWVELLWLQTGYAS